jgi:hypothetical protein
MDIDARAFGQLEGEVKALHAMLLDQNKALAALTLQLDQVNRTLAEAKGGWKTLVWLGGVSAAASSLLTWAVAHVPFK